MPSKKPRSGRADSRRTSESDPAPATPKIDPVMANAIESTLCHEVDGLVYVLDAAPRRGARGRNVVTVRHTGQDSGPGLTDRCDLFSFRSRHALAQTVADSFGRDVGSIMGHLAVVLDQAERGAKQETPEQVVTGERRQAAEKLLALPDLLDRAARTMESLGHVGEDAVKRLAYLVATSRLLTRPLSALLLAPSGTGKSAVLDAVSALMPPEQVVSVARLTPASLYYMGPDALRHRLVIVDEFEGQAEAEHAIRVLQSRGELTMSATVKGKAESFTVRGPVAVMSGTTSSSIDAQNLSRCIELPLDDSPAQTGRVQAAQARAWSGKGASVDTAAWQDAQRVLEAREVVIPFAPRLSFPARTTADRRASAKLLGLIAAHALLHQRQRKLDEKGRVVAVPANYRAVHALLRPLVEHAADGLSPRAVCAYQAFLVAKCSASRRDLAAKLAVSYNTAKSIISELLGQELLAVVDHGPPARYRIIERGLGITGAGLLDPDDLDP